MTEIFSLTCPSCGGKLQITNEIDRFTCAHCGKEHIVRRDGGIITLSPVIEGIDRVQISVDKTASELAIIRLRNEILVLEKELKQENIFIGESERINNIITIVSLTIAAISFVIYSSNQIPITILISILFGIIGVISIINTSRQKRKIDFSKIELINKKKSEINKHEMIVNK